MDGLAIGGLCKTRWLCPLANTDAGNLEYCGLLRRPVALEVLYLLCWKREKSDQIPFCPFCLRRPTKNMWRRRQYLIRGPWHDEMDCSLSARPGLFQGAPYCDTSLPPQMNIAKNRLGQTRT